VFSVNMVNRVTGSGRYGNRDMIFGKLIYNARAKRVQNRDGDGDSIGVGVGHGRFRVMSRYPQGKYGRS
jgi:hypothetical protein